MSEQASKKIRETAARLEPAMLGGLFKGSMTMLTPPDVRRRTKAPPFWKRRALVKADLSQSAKSLHSQRWQTSQGKVHNLHVYDAGLDFPDACPVNLEPPSHHEVVEECIVRRSLRYQTDTPKERANRLLAALSSDRYWFAIPFSAQHGPDDRAVHIEPVATGPTSSRAKLVFTNREYARRFAKLNDVEAAKWLSGRHVIMQVAGYLGLIPSIGLAGAFGFAIYEGLRGDWGPLAPGTTILWFVLGLILGGASIYLWVKGARGEPI